jgi:methionyl-tRNA synthetase
MIGKAFGGKLPEPGAFAETDRTILAAADAMIGTAREHMKTQQLHQVLNCLWAVVADANRYFASEAPWALAKTDPKRQGTVLYVTAEVLRQVAFSRSRCSGVSFELLTFCNRLMNGTRRP